MFIDVSMIVPTLGSNILFSKGSVRLAGSIAFCDQSPWILNANLRENILFGKEFDELLFDLAIRASALESDLTVLPGDILLLITL